MENSKSSSLEVGTYKEEEEEEEEVEELEEEEATGSEEGNKTTGTGRDKKEDSAVKEEGYSPRKPDRSKKLSHSPRGCAGLDPKTMSPPPLPPPPPPPAASNDRAKSYGREIGEQLSRSLEGKRKRSRSGSSDIPNEAATAADQSSFQTAAVADFQSERGNESRERGRERGGKEEEAGKGDRGVQRIGDKPDEGDSVMTTTSTTTTESGRRKRSSVIELIDNDTLVVILDGEDNEEDEKEETKPQPAEKDGKKDILLPTGEGNQEYEMYACEKTSYKSALFPGEFPSFSANSVIFCHPGP